ncbi:Na+/H+ antiporter NhaA [uncultured Bacteroides sp.]|jgi:NhaA family Na+:H+ antiporter|uniref:Na+/H+ antiporter NhaA n=1 Tax=uncultured Bacteroides sp. TaxID=162156 RepID=UPI0025FC9B50|nr:Na+/H+ antiporter NhaA [uncultured Bacteroides sp.]
MVHKQLKCPVSPNIAASIFLFVAAILAAVIANSSWAPAYQEFLAHELHLRIGDFNLFSHGGRDLRMIEFINDGLMTFFFVMVGLEIKRELLVGELSSLRKASLPFIAACGGMLLPVLIYMLFCRPGEDGGQGMAIPMATDIAFSLGVLSLLGNRVPLSLKIFLTAFAVVDDIGGILVIALFYSSHVSLGYLVAAAVLYAFLYFLGRRGATSKVFFFIFGVIIWYLFLQSGIHSTISGVILAFVIPAKPRMDVGKYIERIRTAISEFPTMDKESIVLTNSQIAKLKELEAASDHVISPLQSMEDSLHGIVNFVILPLFAFVNAGVVFSGGGELVGNVSMAVGVGLVAGKFAGIYLFTWLAIRLHISPMPQGMTWANLSGIALLGGIGFTVSLFIANLSFGADFPVFLNQAKLGVLSGSILSGCLGYLVLSRVLR